MLKFFSQIPASWGTDIIKIVGNSGIFGAGALFGGGLASLFYYLASKERIERIKYEHERDKNLLEQLKLKDQRIDALHAELAKDKKGKK